MGGQVDLLREQGMRHASQMNQRSTKLKELSVELLVLRREFMHFVTDHFGQLQLFNLLTNPGYVEFVRELASFNGDGPCILRQSPESTGSGTSSSSPEPLPIRLVTAPFRRGTPESSSGSSCPPLTDCSPSPADEDWAPCSPFQDSSQDSDGPSDGNIGLTVPIRFVGGSGGTGGDNDGGEGEAEPIGGGGEGEGNDTRPHG